LTEAGWPSLYPSGISLRAGKARAPLALALVAATVGLSAAAPGASAAIPWFNGCDPALPGHARTSSTCGAYLAGGRAVAPPYVPPAVKQAIAAANRIDGRPYVWGGGHLGWRSRGYDCSGAVGYALHAAGMLEVTEVSGQLASWGEAGTGRWITIYANADHVYMQVAGLRFDTRDDLPGVSGPRWHQELAEGTHFAARHPAGL
jgi:cell wall-associated NlpC family hydrolase